MKKIIIILSLLHITVYIYAQTPEWLWTKNVGEFLASSTGYEITLDDSGNSYVTGNFSGTVNFDTYSFTSSGSYDIFVAKMDTNGNWLWVVQAGGSENDSGYGISLDDNGNCYVTGHFSGTANFGSYSFISSGSYDIFVAKLDTNGNWLWAVQAGGNDYDCGQGIAIDELGNCYTTGYFGSTSNFGSLPLSSSGSYDVFVAKLDTNGNWLWATQAGGSGFDSGNEIAIDDFGNCYITGYFNNTSNFGSFPLSSSGSNDIFVAKMDTNGNWLWATQAGGIDSDLGQGIALDDYGNCYVTGRFGYIASFGSYSLTSSGDYDIFVAKLDSNSNWLWATRVGSIDYDSGNDIVIDDYSNCYVTGFFKYSVTFGTHWINSNGQSDIFVAKMDEDGNWLWATQKGGSDFDGANGIAVDEYSSCYVTGSTMSYITVAKYGIDYKADFSTNLTLGYVPLSVDFTDLSILPSSIIEWSWEFGDGYTSSLQDPSHEYLLPGIFSVSLTVADSNDYIDSEVKSGFITVYSTDPPAPPPNVLVDIVYPDAVISWTAVDTTIIGDPCITDGYIVSYSEIPDDDYFWFLAFTTSTDYTHQDVAQYSSQMFYNVLSYVDLSRDEIQYLKGLNDSHHKIRWSNVKRNLKKYNSTK